MAHLPVFEEVLLHIHRGLGLERPESKHIRQLTTLGFPVKRHQERIDRLLDDIYAALELSGQAKLDARARLGEWCDFERALAARVWTHDASQAQVLWHMLAYVWVPRLARQLALWSLQGSRRGAPFDAGMPGGRFWFLPQPDPACGELRMPIPQVVDWLIDLLGEQSLEKGFGDVLRTLQGWRAQVLPKSAAKINALFHDGVQLAYLGSFTPANDATPEEHATAALSFIRGKHLGPHALAREIPVGAGAIATFMQGGADPALAAAIVRALAIRYAKAPLKMVRQRLRVARLVQDGVERLFKALAVADPSPQAHRRARSAMLSLLGLFHTLYNRTIESASHGTTPAQQDHWFESGFPEWDRDDLLLSVLPSRRNTAAARLGERLTRRFSALAPDAPLEDLVASGDPEQAATMTARRLHWIESEQRAGERLRRLASALPATAPWPALEAEHDFHAVKGLVGSTPPASPLHAALINRMRELAATPVEQMEARVTELQGLLLCRAGARPAGVQARVQQLLDDIERQPAFELWKAPLLWLRARHRLNQNDVDGASGDYRAALQACFARNYGALRLLAANEGLAVEIARKGLDPHSQELYFRHLRQSPATAKVPATLEDAAVEAEAVFWGALYQPYHGIEPVQGQLTDELKRGIGQSIELIHSSNLSGLKAWLCKFERSFRSVKMRDARRDSILLLWIKQMELHRQFPVFLMRKDADARRAIETMQARTRQAIAALLELWPEHARIADFKGQTPLMLAADNGDAELTRMLAPLSDPDAQDHIGRTALHAAVTGGAPECVATVLDLDPNVLLVTYDEEQTALHTAVRLGQPAIVALVADAFPGLTGRANSAGMTPLDTAADIADHYDDWHAHMRRQNRHIGSRADYATVSTLLRSAALDGAPG